ncbi:Top3b, partial [Symbiodinium sp. CCMP2456]
VKAATQSQCGSEAGWALYELVCRHFLASVSPDAALQEAEVAFVLGPARFVAASRRVRDPGWTRVAQVRLQEIGEIDLSTGFREGDAVTVQRTVLSRHLTAPPKHLTESELLALMDQHGI